MKIQYVRDSPYNAYYETSIIQKYNLSSAWNIASTWTYAGCHNLNYISDSDGVTNMAISPDGAYVIVEDEDNNKKIFEFGTAWDVETLSLLTTKSASGVPQAYSSDGKYLYTVDSSDTIRQLVLQ
jgi:WD40 repeat protein